MITIFLLSIWKAKYLTALAILLGIFAILYVMSYRWRRFNNTFVYGGGSVGVRSQYPHNLSVGDLVELTQDNPPPNSNYTCNESGKIQDLGIDGNSKVIFVIDKYNFVVDKQSSTDAILNPGWWKKIQDQN